MYISSDELISRYQGVVARAGVLGAGSESEHKPEAVSKRGAEIEVLVPDVTAIQVELGELVADWSAAGHGPVHRQKSSAARRARDGVADEVGAGSAGRAVNTQGRQLGVAALSDLRRFVRTQRDVVRPPRQHADDDPRPHRSTAVAVHTHTHTRLTALFPGLPR